MSKSKNLAIEGKGMTDYQFKYLLDLQIKCEEQEHKIEALTRELEQLRAENAKLKSE